MLYLRRLVMINKNKLNSLIILLIFNFIFLVVKAEAWELKKKDTNIRLDISLIQLDGNIISSKEAINLVMSKSNNEVVIIHFWATWCPPCIKELPQLLKAYTNYKGIKPGLIMVAVDKDPKLVKEFINKSLPKETALPKSVLSLLDKTNQLLFKSTGNNAVPYSLLVKDNKIIYYNRGAQDWLKKPLIPKEVSK